VPKFFQKDTAVAKPSLTPFFADAIWPDTWPTILDKPPTDLFLGAVNSAIGRVCIARHPLIANAKATANVKLPGAINMSYVDGHGGRLPLQQLKTVYWHVNYVPVDDPWKTTP